jgi:hypothetical protein
VCKRTFLSPSLLLKSYQKVAKSKNKKSEVEEINFSEKCLYIKPIKLSHVPEDSIRHCHLLMKLNLSCRKLVNYIVINITFMALYDFLHYKALNFLTTIIFGKSVPYLLLCNISARMYLTFALATGLTFAELYNIAIPLIEVKTLKLHT